MLAKSFRYCSISPESPLTNVQCGGKSTNGKCVLIPLSINYIILKYHNSCYRGISEDQP